MKREDIITEAMPKQGSWLSRLLGGWAFRLLGWQVRGQFPDVKKALIIVAPHTSNWDYIIAMAFKFYVGVRVRYLMKSEAYVWPMRTIFKWTGAVPVYRFQKTDILEQTIDWLKSEDNVWLGIAPEGTRSKIDKWKTGFLRIAHGANIPIFLAGIDGKNKCIILDRFANSQELSGDITTQAQKLQTYFEQKYIGIKPENQ